MKKFMFTLALIFLFTSVFTGGTRAYFRSRSDSPPGCAVLRSKRPFMPIENVLFFLPFQLSKIYDHYLEELSHRYEVFRNQNPDMTFDLAIALVNAGVDLESYYDVQFAPNPYCTAVLINHNFSLPTQWKPSDLVPIGGGHMLREEAARHFNLMRKAMISEGLSIYVAHSFRSYYEQSYLFNRAVNLHGRASAQRQFARPGHSEHNAGLAVDILHRERTGPLSAMNFQHSREFQWLLQNAHEFGFILRYPEAYTHFHRFIFEPWHWRFVGVEIATEMHDSGISTFEEYFGRFLAQAPAVMPPSALCTLQCQINVIPVIS